MNEPTTSNVENAPSIAPLRVETIPAAAPTQDSQAGLMAVIARAAADPNVNVDKMERLYAMMEKENARIAEQSFNEAMTQAQNEMPMVIKKSTNPNTNSKYAKLEAVKIAIAPVVSKHGFSLMFSEGKPEAPGKIRILCDVRHRAGHSVQRHMDLSPDDTGMKGLPTKTKIHGEGSTFSYGCRYLTAMIFNVIIVGEDNDGNQSNRPKPSGPAPLASDLAALKKQLWDLLKPVVAQNPQWDKSNWNGHNQFLWREEILDAAANEAAPELTTKRFSEVIEQVKQKI